MQEFKIERNENYHPEDEFLQRCTTCGNYFHPEHYVIIYNDSAICDECGAKYVGDLFGLIVVTRHFQPEDIYNWNAKAKTDENYKWAAEHPIE